MVANPKKGRNSRLGRHYHRKEGTTAKTESSGENQGKRMAGLSSFRVLSGEKGEADRWSQEEGGFRNYETAETLGDADCESRRDHRRREYKCHLCTQEMTSHRKGKGLITKVPVTKGKMGKIRENGGGKPPMDNSFYEETVFTCSRRGAGGNTSQ